MKKRLCMLALLLGWASLSVAQALTVVSDNWEGYTNKDGTGLYWEIIATAFQGTNVQPQFITMPWKRAQTSVRNGDADAIVGIYHQPRETAYRYPNWHISIEDPIVLLTNQKKALPNTVTPQDLEGLKLAWVRGYDFNSTLLRTVSVQFQEVTRVEQAIQLVDSQRIDALLDYEVSIQQAADKLGMSISEKFNIVHVAAGNKLYIAFHNGAAAKQWAQLFDQRMEELANNGTIADIYRKWQIPVSKFGAEHYATLP